MTQRRASIHQIEHSLPSFILLQVFKRCSLIPFTMPRLEPTHSDEHEEEEEEETDQQTNLTHLVAQVIVQLQYTVTVTTGTKKGKSTVSKSKIARRRSRQRQKIFPSPSKRHRPIIWLFSLLYLKSIDTWNTLQLPLRHDSISRPLFLQTKRRSYNLEILLVLVLTCFYFSKKDAIDVDNFSEYERMAKTVIEKKPSKFSIFVNLDDVKTGATRVRHDHDHLEKNIYC